MTMPTQSQKELTLRGLILGVLITLVFTAAQAVLAEILRSKG